MNQIRFKQNHNPNLPQENKNHKLNHKQHLKLTTRSQSQQPFQNKTLAQNISLKNIDGKINKKNQYRAAEIYYQDEIINFISKKATQKYKEQKNLTMNTRYISIRSLLIQEIYKQVTKLNLKPQTYYTFLSYLDSYMRIQSTFKLPSQSLLIAGYACYLMALKFEEIYPPSIDDWLPKNLHKKVFKWQGQVIYDINFKFITQSCWTFLQFYGEKYKLTERQFKECKIVLDAMSFNHQILYKFEPFKLVNALILLEYQKKQKRSPGNISETFDSRHQKQTILNCIRKFIISNPQKIFWIKQLNQ